MKQKTTYGNTVFNIIDQEAGSSKPLMTLTKRTWAMGVLAELTRDPKIAPGVRVRFAADVHNFAGSERDELHRITADKYGAGEEGVLAFPHPNQTPDGCAGWWYIEVDSKSGEPRKLYVGVWPGGFEIILNKE
jgi:hypothetical protein